MGAAHGSDSDLKRVGVGVALAEHPGIGHQLEPLSLAGFLKLGPVGFATGAGLVDRACFEVDHDQSAVGPALDAVGGSAHGDAPEVQLQQGFELFFDADDFKGEFAIVFVALALGFGPGLGHVQGDLAGEQRVAGVERRRHFFIYTLMGPSLDAVQSPGFMVAEGLVKLLVHVVQGGSEGVCRDAVVGARFFADLEHVAHQKEVGVLEKALESGGAQTLALQGVGD